MRGLPLRPTKARGGHNLNTGSDNWNEGNADRNDPQRSHRSGGDHGSHRCAFASGVARAVIDRLVRAWYCGLAGTSVKGGSTTCRCEACGEGVLECMGC
jgi:hypothetical protein